MMNLWSTVQTTTSTTADVDSAQIVGNYFSLPYPDTTPCSVITLSNPNPSTRVNSRGYVAGNTAVGCGGQTASAGARWIGNDVSGIAFGAGLFISQLNSATHDNLVADNYFHDSVGTIDVNTTPNRGIECHGQREQIVGNKLFRNGGSNLNQCENSTWQDNTAGDNDTVTLGDVSANFRSTGKIANSNSGNGSTFSGNVTTNTILGVDGGSIVDYDEIWTSTEGGCVNMLDNELTTIHFSAVPCNGRYETVLKGTTSDTTPVRLTSDQLAAGYANTLNNSTGATYNVSIELSAVNQTTPTSNYVWTLPIGVLYRDGLASTTAWTAGTPVSVATGTTAGLAIATTADTTRGGLNLTFTPPTLNANPWTVTARVKARAIQ
jgi:hypothetical protein